jgi:hypothetical protein
MGFAPGELISFATQAGLVAAKVTEIPAAFWAASRRGRAERVPWLALTAKKRDAAEEPHGPQASGQSQPQGKVTRSKS